LEKGGRLERIDVGANRPEKLARRAWRGCVVDAAAARIVVGRPW
jgi:hypothetical protein